MAYLKFTCLKKLNARRDFLAADLVSGVPDLFGSSYCSLLGFLRDALQVLTLLKPGENGTNFITEKA